MKGYNWFLYQNTSEITLSYMVIWTEVILLDCNYVKMMLVNIAKLKSEGSVSVFQSN